MPQPKTIEIILNEYDMNKFFRGYLERNGRTIDEIILKLLGHDDSVAIGNGYHDDCHLEAEETKQALADHLLGLPSLQYGTVDNHQIGLIRQEIAEALGVKEASGEAGELFGRLEDK